GLYTFSTTEPTAAWESIFNDTDAEITYNHAIKVARELERIHANTITCNAENHESNPERFPESVEIPSEGIDVIIDESEGIIVRNMVRTRMPMLIMNGELFLMTGQKTL
ncbi:1416_t:CDS:2, partial [Paraglomus brasilianum]